MKRRLLLLVCFAAICLNSAFAEQSFTEPAAPHIDEPTSKQETSKNQEELKLPATLCFASGEKLKGFMHPESPVFTIEAGAGVLREKQTFQWSELISVSVVSWQKIYKGKDEYLFKVSSAFVETAGGVLKCGSLPDKISFTDSFRKKRIFFTCFYDYRKNGKWTNSGSGDEKFPATHPHPDTVVSITFEKPAPEGILRFPF